ncbi:hypothetical protein MTO96_041193 [Rhipicephalus appendiculatus]
MSHLLIFKLDGEMLEKDLYHDTRYFSSVMVSQENGLQVEGVLGPMFGIKPSMANTRTWRGSIAHVIYEIPPETEGRNGNADKVVRPEVFVAVDSALAGQFKDHLKLLKYMAISMNSVNIRYSTIKHPRVQLRLCALEVLTEREETFLYKVDRYVASGRSIQRIKQYVEYSYKYVEYDAVYFATGLDIARFKGYGWDATEQGLAYVGGACTTQKVALGEDKADTYKGVRIFAHEMGHLLGCPHDGEKHKDFTSESCPWDHGFIMSYIEHNSRSLKFSTCCNNMIRQHVYSVAGKCLLIQNTRRKIKKANFTRDLAGDHVGRDQYCKLTFPEYPGTYVLPDTLGRCHVHCYMPQDITSLGYKQAFLPDNSRCNESDGEYTETMFLYRVDGYLAAYRSLQTFRDYVSQNAHKYGEFDAVYLVTGSTGHCVLELGPNGRISKDNYTNVLPGEYITKEQICKSTFPEVKGTYLKEEGIVNPRMRIVPLQTEERSQDGRIAHQLIEIPDDISSDNEDYGKE